MTDLGDAITRLHYSKSPLASPLSLHVVCNQRKGKTPDFNAQMDESSAVTTEPLFRSVKRRKVFRKRQEEDEDERSTPLSTPAMTTTTTASENGAPTQASNVTSDTVPEISQVLKARRMNKSRGHGIEFSSTTVRGSRSDETEGQALPDENLRPQGIEDRFVGHSGQVVDVDKHMIAYVESEMAKRRNANDLSSQPTHSSSDPQYRTTITTSSALAADRNPTTLGKIQEIDLGEASALRNMQRTEAAIRRQQGGGEDLPPLEDEDAAPRKKKKERIRIGRNGKPYVVKRGPKPRNSEDIERDRIVEAVMREARPDLYDTTILPPPATSQPSNPTHNEMQSPDLETDELIATEFRTAFLEAMASRPQRHPATTKTGTDKKKDENNPLKGGPKLGGSRSARAAMHRAMLEGGAGGGGGGGGSGK